MRVDFEDLLTFLRAYANGPLTGSQVHTKLPEWDMRKIYRLRRYSLTEELLELAHTAPEEPWYQMPSKHHRLTAKGQKLLKDMK